jgi:hypothetical protein
LNRSCLVRSHSATSGNGYWIRLRHRATGWRNTPGPNVLSFSIRGLGDRARGSRGPEASQVTTQALSLHLCHRLTRVETAGFHAMRLSWPARTRVKGAGHRKVPAPFTRCQVFLRLVKLGCDAVPIYKVCVHPGCRATYVPQRGVRRCPPHEVEYVEQRNAVRRTRGKSTYDSPSFHKARKHLRDTIGYCVGPGPPIQASLIAIMWTAT